MINIDNLPEPDVLIIPTYEQLLADNTEVFTNLMPDHQPLDSDPYQLVLQAFAYRELHLRQLFNNKLKSMLLLYASSSDLDLVAADNYQIKRLNGENDHAFKKRVLRSLDGYSTAGSLASYEYHTYSVSADITHVKAFSPEKGKVTVVIFSNKITISEALRLQVEQALSADKVRPITDTVNVVIAKTITPSISATIYLSNSDERATVKTNIMTHFKKLLTDIGEELPLSKQIAFLHVAGVFKVALDNTSDINCDKTQIIQFSEEQLNLTFAEAIDA